MEDEAARAGDLEEAVLADDLDEGVDLGGRAGHLDRHRLAVGVDDAGAPPWARVVDRFTT